jgi:hypothetical protein
VGESEWSGGVAGGCGGGSSNGGGCVGEEEVEEDEEGREGGRGGKCMFVAEAGRERKRGRRQIGKGAREEQ